MKESRQGAETDGTCKLRCIQKIKISKLPHMHGRSYAFWNSDLAIYIKSSNDTLKTVYDCLSVVSVSREDDDISRRRQRECHMSKLSLNGANDSLREGVSLIV